MRGKSLALLILALGCGLVASIGITQVLAKRGGEAPQATAETEPIFVALEDIGLGDPLNSQMLKIEQWPKDKVPEGALTKIEDIEGRRARTKLFAGEPILDRKLLKKGESSGGVSPLIPKGMRVVSVEVDKVSSGGGLILPGDRVDVAVFLTQNCRKGIPETSTRMVLQDIKVFAVNDVHNFSSEESGKTSITNASTVSLLVTPPQSHKLMLASEMGKLRLVLRSPEDEGHSDEQAATFSDLLAGDAGNREQETLMEPEPEPQEDDDMKGFMAFLQQNLQNPGPAAATQQATSAPQMPAGPMKPDNATWNMRVVRANDIQEVTLEKSTDPMTGGSTWHQGGMGGLGVGPDSATTPDGFTPFTGAPPADDGPPQGEPTDEPDDDFEPDDFEPDPDQ